MVGFDAGGFEVDAVEVDGVEVDGVEALCPNVITAAVDSTQKMATQRESLQTVRILALMFGSIGYLP